MTVKIIRGAEVSRPTPTPITSSVMDHATVVDKSDFGLRNAAGMWPSYNCLDLLVPTALCPEPLAEGETPAHKQFKSASWVPGFAFAVYGGVQCSAVGLDVADQKAEVARVFSLSEGRGVEQALLLNRFVALEEDDESTDPMAVSWDGPVDLTPTTGIPLHVALALLEGYAAAHYAGVPTIHMPRAAATVLEASGLVVWNGDKAYTKNGSKVAIGGGYDTDEALASGQWDLFATGEVYVERSEEVSVHAYTMPGDGSGTEDGQNGLSPNTSVALAERMFRVAIDCFVAKATGTVWT